MAVLSLLIWGGLAIARAVRRPRTPDPAHEESVANAGPIRPPATESLSGLILPGPPVRPPETPSSSCTATPAKGGIFRQLGPGGACTVDATHR